MNVETFGSVSGALAATKAEAPNMKARAGLSRFISEQVNAWDLAQTQAALRLGISRSRLNNLLHGKLENFSLDFLVNLATAADLVVEIRVRPRGTAARAPGISPRTRERRL
jgi:predicted XRE-type DNA-binding protein